MTKDVWEDSLTPASCPSHYQERYRVFEQSVERTRGQGLKEEILQTNLDIISPAI